MKILKTYNQIFENKLTDDEYYLADLVRDNEIDEVEKILIKTKPDLNEFYTGEYLILLDATSLEMIDLLISYGADINLVNGDGDGLFTFLGYGYNFNDLMKRGIDISKSCDDTMIFDRLSDDNQEIIIKYYPEEYKKYLKKKNVKKFKI